MGEKTGAHHDSGPAGVCAEITGHLRHLHMIHFPRVCIGAKGGLARGGGGGGCRIAGTFPCARASGQGEPAAGLAALKAAGLWLGGS